MTADTDICEIKRQRLARAIWRAAHGQDISIGQGRTLHAEIYADGVTRVQVRHSTGYVERVIDPGDLDLLPMDVAANPANILWREGYAAF